MSSQAQRYQTQWASQFYAAAELTRRGYLVSLTLGNAPAADLLATSPGGKTFMVDVKGQATRNFWLVQRRQKCEDLYFILVYLPKDLAQPPQYFLLSCTEMMAEREAYRLHIESTSGKYREEMGGMNWGEAGKYADRWGILPE